jgi:hypothetical protein
MPLGHVMRARSAGSPAEAEELVRAVREAALVAQPAAQLDDRAHAARVVLVAL